MLQQNVLMKQLVPTLDAKPSKDTLRVVEGVTAFITILLKEEPANLLVHTYQGFQGNTEITNVRYQVNDQVFVFGLLASNFDRWMDAVLDEETIEWCQRSNGNKDLQDRNLWLNVSPANNYRDIKFNLPFEMLNTPDLVNDPFKDQYNELYINYGNAAERLSKALVEDIKEAIGKTNTFVIDKAKRDHDLFIAFRAVNDYQNLEIHIEQVFPELPPSGEVNLGSNPLREWVTDNKKSILAFRQIQVIEKHINRNIEKMREEFVTTDYLIKDFKELMKITTLAASHFTKRIYQFEKEGNEALVNKAANEIVRKLTYKGGNIGLDLNSWIVWDYNTPGQVTKVTDEELDFANILPKLYIESFVEGLYQFLINLGNPFIKPYDNRTPVLEDDGIAIGSIRVNETK